MQGWQKPELLAEEQKQPVDLAWVVFEPQRPEFDSHLRSLGGWVLCLCQPKDSRWQPHTFNDVPVKMRNCREQAPSASGL